MFPSGIMGFKVSEGRFDLLAEQAIEGEGVVRAYRRTCMAGGNDYSAMAVAVVDGDNNEIIAVDQGWGTSWLYEMDWLPHTDPQVKILEVTRQPWSAEEPNWRVKIEFFCKSRYAPDPERTIRQYDVLQLSEQKRIQKMLGPGFSDIWRFIRSMPNKISDAAVATVAHKVSGAEAAL